MSNLSDEGIRAVFHSFDEDESGMLAVKELRKALNMLCIDPTDSELQEKLAEDEETEVMSEEEFVTFVRRFADMDYKQKCLECFSEFDEEGKGRLTWETVKRILTQMGSDPIEPEVADELIQRFDTNEDGIVSIEELVTMLYDTEGLF